VDTPELQIEETQARQWLDAAAGRHVLVVGDAMLDRYLAGAVDRISPEAPVPVVQVTDEHAALGGAANVAAGVASLGVECRLIAAVGDDPASTEFRALLTDLGIDDSDLESDATRPTTQKTRIVARHQQILRVDRESTTGLSAAAATSLRDRTRDALEWADVLIVQDYDKGVLSGEFVATLLATARERGVVSIVDPKLRHFFDCRGATVFKPNVREMAAALGHESAPTDEATLRVLVERLECDHLLLTLGEDGMLRIGAGEMGVHHIPSRAREVFDVTGAGDTVVAVLAAAFAGGADAAQAAVLANTAAGIEVSRLGAVPVSRQDLLEVLAED
jgi:D-beta-D-heptose 7-phosphate kinase/D-beta-D-heptose 1-phosphate adenosyltransferase